MAVFKRTKTRKTLDFIPKIAYYIEWVVWGSKMLIWLAESIRNMPAIPSRPQETVQNVQAEGDNTSQVD